MLLLPLEEVLLKQVSPKPKKGDKKLVSVLATSTPLTETREEAVETVETGKTAEVVETTGAGKDGKQSKGKYSKNLAQVLCIQYLIIFRKKSVLALLDSNSEVNAIHPTFTQELRLSIRPIDVGAEKINSTTPDTFGMVVSAFSVTNKAN